MSDRQKSLNDTAWEELFEKHDILAHIERTGQFQISAKQIKEVREPRLMAKFDDWCKNRKKGMRPFRKYNLKELAL